MIRSCWCRTRRRSVGKARRSRARVGVGLFKARTFDSWCDGERRGLDIVRGYQPHHSITGGRCSIRFSGPASMKNRQNSNAAPAICKISDYRQLRRMLCEVRRQALMDPVTAPRKYEPGAAGKHTNAPHQICLESIFSGMRPR